LNENISENGDAHMREESKSSHSKNGFEKDDSDSFKVEDEESKDSSVDEHEVNEHGIEKSDDDGGF
jgi:hypothetical protein